MSSSLKSKVEEDFEEYSLLLEMGLENYSKYEENNLIDLKSLETILIKLKVEPNDCLILKIKDDELVTDTLEKLQEEQELDQELFKIALKRAFILKCMKDDFDYMFERLSREESNITRETFADSLKDLPPLKADQNVLQAMINIVGGFPITKQNFQRLLIVTGYLDQKIAAFDSVLKKKSKARTQKRTKTS